MHKGGKRTSLFYGMVLCGTVLYIVVTPVRFWPQVRGTEEQPLATEQRVRSTGWWPTQGTPRREEYVGPAACAQCHSSEAAVQETTPMAKACVRAADSKVLKAHERLSFRLGQYVYDLTRAGGSSTFSVSDGARAISVVLEWAFGKGEVGETYVFERQGVFYEGRLSYFPVLQGLDITPGHSHSTPSDLEGAIGRPMEPEEIHLCFGCHSTASSTGGQFDPDRLIPGVTCEACHGPGAKHVSAMKRGRIAEGLTHVVNPAKLGPVDSVEFWGAWSSHVGRRHGGGHGRGCYGALQPYRLESSRCWGKGDARITCLACHDPHLPLVRDSASYDNRCLRCHLTTKGSKGASDHPGTACPQGTKDCVTCHMPKYEVPDTHTKFTDHRIRVVKSERSYPD